MLNDADVALARLANLAYSFDPTALPTGFYPVSVSALGINLHPAQGESYANGVYSYENGSALVLTGTIDGQTTAVLVFRGSDNEQDSINDLQGDNREYSLYGNLIPAFDTWVAKEGIGNVVVTGHSLGGAMDQLYMATHPNTAGASYTAVTFGSSGAQITPGADSRITNVQITDDPAVWLGENRASVGSDLQSNPALAAAAVFAGPEVFPGLTPVDVINSIPDLNSDYVNRGTPAYLPDANGNYTFINSINEAVNAGKSEHLITTYISRLEAATGATGNGEVPAAITPTTTGLQVYRFFDTSNGTHFYTDSRSEVSAVEATRPDLTFEGFGFNAETASQAGSDPNAAPVYRLFDKQDGSHFYTISASERDSTMQLSSYTYEGIAFYEDTAPAANTAPVYRFFDTADGTHFFTADISERASVLASRGDLQNEGVAFYTQTA